MNDQQEHWNAYFHQIANLSLSYDGWLCKHLAHLPAHAKVLDLGCGNGSDTLYLHRNGYRVMPMDFSQAALEHLMAALPDITPILSNMAEPLPFASGSFDAVVSDLSLHYFPWQKTREIVGEIMRVLRHGGVLLCRVNATGDVHHGAQCEEDMIEPGLFRVNGRVKRFFTKENVHGLFASYTLSFCEETRSARYGREKVMWEMRVHKGNPA